MVRLAVVALWLCSGSAHAYELRLGAGYIANADLRIDDPRYFSTYSIAAVLDLHPRDLGLGFATRVRFHLKPWAHLKPAPGVDVLVGGQVQDEDRLWLARLLFGGTYRGFCRQDVCEGVVAPALALEGSHVLFTSGVLRFFVLADVTVWAFFSFRRFLVEALPSGFVGVRF